MKTQINTPTQPVKKLALKKTSIRVLNPSQQEDAVPGPTATCTNPC